MTRNLTASLHYSTHVEGDETKACVSIETLADLLPHGSGFDGDWYIAVTSRGAVNICGEYHGMDENGMYCGWSTFRFSLRRATEDKSHVLRGPCAGQIQVTQRKGDILMTPVRGAGALNEYIEEVIGCEIRALLTHRSELLPAEAHGVEGASAV